MRFFKKTFCAVSLIFVFIFLFEFSAVAKTAVENEMSSLENEILTYNLGKNNVPTEEAFIKEVLPKQIGIDAEWFVMAFSHFGDYDFINYVKSLDEYLASHNVQSATSRQKFALAYIAAGEKTNEYVKNIALETIGNQGIMSYVYGLHLLNNGCSHDLYSEKDIINEIISKVNSDGGWSVTGNISDVDVTSMVLQALSPYYKGAYSNVDEAVNSALKFLSDAQQNSGDYISYGVSNPESGAQVIVALSSLGIDFFHDERFIKSGNTILDGILNYKLSDGSFCHVKDGKTNPNSTVQVYFSAVAYNLFKANNKRIYVFDSKNTDDSSNSSSDNSESLSEESIEFSKDSTNENSLNEISSNDSSANPDGASKTKISLKLIFLSVIVFFTILAGVIIFIKGKRNYKNFVVLIAVSLVAICFVMFSDIQSKEEYYTSIAQSKDNVSGVVTMSIDCKKVIDKSHASHIPQDGIILAKAKFEIEDGDTVYDVLIQAAKTHSIHVENNGNDEMAYIAGINYLYEFDFGDLSGWMFYVNGEEASEGCSSYKLSDGDVIEWKYTLQMGKD